jgi:hypothetical protein
MVANRPTVGHDAPLRDEFVMRRRKPFTAG